MGKREMIGIVLLSMIVSAVITAIPFAGLRVDLASIVFAVFFVAVVAGVIAAILCLVLGRLS